MIKAALISICSIIMACFAFILSSQLLNIALLSDTQLSITPPSEVFSFSQDSEYQRISNALEIATQEGPVDIDKVETLIRYKEKMEILREQEMQAHLASRAGKFTVPDSVRTKIGMYVIGCLLISFLFGVVTYWSLSKIFTKQTR